MPVDTRNKRSSAIGIALATRLILPNPFGTIDANARIIVAYSYRGIAAAAPSVPPMVPATGSSLVMVPGRQRQVSVPPHVRLVIIPKGER